MRWISVLSFLLLEGQSVLRIGGDFLPQKGLQRVDTTFRLVKAPLYLWAEVRVLRPLEWDTLWVVIRDATSLSGVYPLFRSPNDKLLYRGKIIFKQAGIYVLSVIPPRQPRLILTRPSRLYITSPQYPTIAALKQRTSNITSATTENTILATEMAMLDTIEVAPEPLLTPEGGTMTIEESLLIEDPDSLLEIPEEILPEEDIEMEDFELEEDL
ncbi:MAG: hypothetical protein RMJ66_03075 [Bacteroidia bacterium]|nr:hypothetical protein [Bacteroidia bacterium]MDW8134028.1 hypothetical protein [Bacteroidia bacterium]